jgi:hypothetical protein
MATTFKAATQEQIDACTRVIDEAKHEVFYQVQSATDAEAAYQVRYNHQYKVLSCNCKVGQIGLICWHLRAVREHNRLHVELKRAEAEAQERLENWKRVLAAKPATYTETEIQRDLALNTQREFRLMR